MMTTAMKHDKVRPIAPGKPGHFFADSGKEDENEAQCTWQRSMRHETPLIGARICLVKVTPLSGNILLAGVAISRPTLRQAQCA